MAPPGSYSSATASRDRAGGLEVKIPQGVDNGSRIRVRPDESGSEEVYLVVSVRPDSRFERRGSDLYTKVNVPLVDAVLGGEVGRPPWLSR